jgi:hypothetical protein
MRWVFCESANFKRLFVRLVRATPLSVRGRDAVGKASRR